MHRALSILFLSLYLFDLVGYMATFWTVRSQIRREVKQRIKKSVPVGELVVIIVTDPSDPVLQWITPTEFRYRGGLYDVVRTDHGADSTRFLCLNDEQEERLFAALDAHVRRQMESDPRATARGTAAGPAAGREHLPAPLPIIVQPVVIAVLEAPSVLLPSSPARDVPVPPPRMA